MRIYKSLKLSNFAEKITFTIDDLNALVSASCKHNLFINSSKCFFVFFDDPHAIMSLDVNVNMSLDDISLLILPSIRNLGLPIDKNF